MRSPNLTNRAFEPLESASVTEHPIATPGDDLVVVTEHAYIRSKHSAEETTLTTRIPTVKE